MTEFDGSDLHLHWANDPFLDAVIIAVESPGKPVRLIRACVTCCGVSSKTVAMLQMAEHFFSVRKGRNSTWVRDFIQQLRHYSFLMVSISQTVDIPGSKMKVIRNFYRKLSKLNLIIII